MNDTILTIEFVIRAVPGLERQRLESWIERDWVRPDRDEGTLRFHEIDLARVRLIHELADELALGEEAMPVVLSLLDQLYETRRRMRELARAIAAAPEEQRRILLDLLAAGQEPPNQL